MDKDYNKNDISIVKQKFLSSLLLLRFEIVPINVVSDSLFAWLSEIGGKKKG